MMVTRTCVGAEGTFPLQGCIMSNFNTNRSTHASKWHSIWRERAQGNSRFRHCVPLQVRMWVYEEEFEGRKLTDWINNYHENKKYLPGFQLPPNLRAVPSLVDACKDADLLVFVMPHQFIEVGMHGSFIVSATGLRWLGSGGGQVELGFSAVRMAHSLSSRSEQRSRSRKV